MDALHPRLLVDRFAECFEFYDAFLTRVLGAELRKGSAAGPYANWDVDDQGVLVLFDRGVMAGVVGTADLPAGPRERAWQDAAMFVCRVDDVDAAYAVALEHGGTPVVGPTERPDWGAGLRSAHLRDPQGTLVELQAY